MTEQLQKFYDELWKWIQDGKPKHHIFRHEIGMCSNLYKYGGLIRSFTDELRIQFTKAGLDVEYPFGKKDYNERLRYGSMYECPKRLKWIETHTTDYRKKRETKIKILNYVRKNLIAKIGYGFVCLQIEEYNGGSYKREECKTELIEYMDLVLDGSSNLQLWLIDNNIELPFGKSTNDARIELVDWMIQCYKEDLENVSK